MLVIKRDGRRESVKFDKVTARIEKLCYGLHMDFVSPVEVAKKVIDGIYDGVTTVELDNLAAETAASLTTKHPDYATLAARIAVSNLHKVTAKSFSSTMRRLHTYEDPKTGENASLIARDVWEIIHKHAATLDSAIIYDRDYNYDFFGFKTLERSYLLRLEGKVVERPQHMLMRVAVGIHKEDIDSAIKTYHMLSERWFTHATPTLFNAGTPKPQMSSCFLLTVKDDSIEGIYETLKDCALISQSAGGIGLAIHNVRATGSYIKGTNGNSNGLVPMLKVFNDTARYVDQCFHPDTLLYTRQGIKRIDDVVLGEELLTGEGEFNRVTRLLRNAYSGPMVEIGVKHSIDPIRVTPGHTFLVLRDQQKMVNYDVIRNRLDKGYLAPEWVEAKDLTENDLLSFPIPEFEEDLLEFSAQDCRFYGMMVGDGHIARDGKAAHITQNRETDDITFIKQYLYEHGIHWTETAAEGEKKIRFTWSAHLGFKFSRTLLYDEQGEKRVHPSLLHLPKAKALQIVRGILETDGCIGKREPVEIALDMTSRNVIESVRYLLLRFGILTSGYVRDRVGNVSSYKNITTRKVSYCLRIPRVADITDLFGLEAGEYTTFFTYGAHTYSRITQLTQQPYDGLVVDFEVEPNHNYVTHVGVAHNGGGKRKGAFAVYLEPWHADIFEFLDLKKNHGKEEMRARDLFYALWTPDLFMQRVEENGDWTLMCPHECPGLDTTWGPEFEKLYTKYEREGKGRRTVKAQELWFAVLESQTETGTPYMLFKDAANRKSNQQNLGTIKSSNLCTEILEYTDKDEIAVCNLASLALPRYLVEDGANGLRFDHDKLYEVTYQATLNLNKVIDVNYYPVPETQRSNFRHRPIGLGVQGLADTFIALRMPFESDEAKGLNIDIFETIYYAAMMASKDLAVQDGPYETFAGSPLSQGKFQFDLWGVTPRSGRWDWDALRAEVVAHGVRNSLLVAPMPTASTAQILGNNESFEPYTSNIYVRRVLSGEFMVVNKHLLKDLVKLGLWNEQMKQDIIAANGSVQGIARIPQHVKDLYKTVWEISQRTIIDMAADRGAYICQSQSLNLHVQNVNFGKLTSMHFHSWKRGLKTGMYYLRTKAAADAIKFTVEKQAAETLEPVYADVTVKNQSDMSCSLDDPEGCEVCGS